MKRILTENLGLKLMALLVAILLWLATVGEPDQTMAVVVPIQYHNIPKNLEVSSELVESAYVEVRGSRGRLAGSAMNNAVVVFNLGNEKRPGERTFSILPDNVNLPPGVEFIRAIPSQIRVRLEPTVVRDVPVVVRYGAIPDGVRIASQFLTPSSVSIVGPESRVLALDNVQTDPVTLPQSVGEHTFRVHAFAGDPNVRLERSDLLVTIKVVLEKAR